GDAAPTLVTFAGLVRAERVQPNEAAEVRCGERVTVLEVANDKLRRRTLPRDDDGLPRRHLLVRCHRARPDDRGHELGDDLPGVKAAAAISQSCLAHVLTSVLPSVLQTLHRLTASLRRGALLASRRVESPGHRAVRNARDPALLTSSAPFLELDLKSDPGSLAVLRSVLRVEAHARRQPLEELAPDLVIRSVLADVDAFVFCRLQEVRALLRALLDHLVELLLELIEALFEALFLLVELLLLLVGARLLFVGAGIGLFEIL